ncbi:MAG TPA: thiamine phosphate synthase [Dehalococcoidia bacterium]|nr:thiamine phosphate synthase [Dehalococcoidia bacterium]
MTRPGASHDRLRGLYVIIDPESARGREEARIAAEAIQGGARLIQLRDKTREKGLQLPIARGIRAACREGGALFFINDHVDLALAVDADGVHLGQKDLPLTIVRHIVPSRMLIGCSTNNPDEARQAEKQGADYVSVGRLFPTGSKQDTRPATLETLRAVKGAVSIPVCAIGGIDESNIDAVIDAGADMVSVIAAVTAAEDVLEAARRLSKRFPAGY